MSATTALIVALRNTAKLSQSEISRRTGIPQPRISRWEAGEAPDSADDALKLQALHNDLVGAHAEHADSGAATDAAGSVVA